MLARATVRSLKLCSRPALIQATFPCFQSRTYAKSKPRKPFEYKAPTGSHASATNDADSRIPEKPVSSAIEAQRATQPSTAQSSSDVPFDKSAERSSSSDYSIDQEEFQTPRNLNGNTAPQFSSSSAIDPAKAQEQDVEQEPPQPLLDLTQGIPSSLDSGIASSSAHADSKSLNITEAPSQPGGQGGGDLPKSAYISSLERRRNRVANYLFGSAFLALFLSAVYLGRNWESEEEELSHRDAPSGWGFSLFYKRIRARWSNTVDYYNEPAFPKLLPDTDPAWARPYTLVLSLEDLLVHSEWSREHGWRLAKRPGVDYFVRYLSQYYELVVFTSVPSMLGGPIIQKLDPYKIIMWPLFREATRYKNGEYIKVGRP